MRHAVPSGDLGAVIERALDALIAATEKRRFGAASARRAAKSNVRTRRIPTSVRRAVFERDGGACAYVDAEGRRCGCTQGVELHHERSRPRAKVSPRRAKVAAAVSGDQLLAAQAKRIQPPETRSEAALTTTLPRSHEQIGEQ
jgi:hypothetical protein